MPKPNSNADLLGDIGKLGNDGDAKHANDIIRDTKKDAPAGLLGDNLISDAVGIAHGLQEVKEGKALPLRKDLPRSPSSSKSDRKKSEYKTPKPPSGATKGKAPKSGRGKAGMKRR